MSEIKPTEIEQVREFLLNLQTKIISMLETFDNTKFIDDKWDRSEGGGGIIYPELHYGRDALVGIALFLALLVDKKCKVSKLKGQYSEYFMKKIKITLEDSNLIDRSFKVIAENYSELSPNTEDGVRIDFEDAWVHMRKSNTEPIIRIFAEANSQDIADSYALKIEKEIKSISA